ncbi:MAG: N utilization substance protein B [Arenicella sp.]|jgi:N utilization substance protein B
MSSRHDARRAAVQALYQWDLTGQAAHEIEAQFSQIHDMQNVDKKYLREILKEVPRLAKDLESDISVHIDRAFARLDPVERAILRLGAYELAHRLDVPTRVVMNEMIELAKVFGSDHSYKFVNGVMDKMAKAMRPDTQKKSVTKPAVKKAAKKTSNKAVKKPVNKTFQKPVQKPNTK